MAEKIIRKLWSERIQDGEDLEKKNKIEIKELECQINEYIDLIPRAKTDSIRARYESKIEDLEDQIKSLKTKGGTKNEPNFDEALNLMLEFLRTPAETWKNVSLELKIMIQNMIFVDNPKYSLETGFRTPNLSLPFLIKDHVDTEKDELVDQTKKFANTFTDYVLEWKERLKLIFSKKDDISP